MKYFSLLVLLGGGFIWGFGHKANLDVLNGFKTAVLTLEMDILRVTMA